MLSELKQYPKAFGEFVEWMIDEMNIPNYYDVFGDLTSDSIANAEELIGMYDEGCYNRGAIETLIIEWLDSKGVYVAVYPSQFEEAYRGIYTIWSYDVYDNNAYETNFTTRSAATKAGIIEAFSLLEEK